MSNSDNLLLLQLELSSHIKLDLDMKAVVPSFIENACRLLDCESAHVWVKCVSGEKLSPYCYPPSLHAETHIPTIVHEVLKAAEFNWENVVGGQVFKYMKQSYQFFPIGKVGIAVFKPNNIIGDQLIDEVLTPVFRRLAGVVEMCVKHRQVELSRQEFEEEKNAAINNGFQKDLLMAKWAEKLDTAAADIVKLSSKQKSFSLQSLNKIRYKSLAVQRTSLEIKEFSHLQNNTFAFDVQPFDIRQSVSKVIHEYSVMAADKDIELNGCFDQSVPKFLLGDKERLQLVLRELVDNALTNTDSGSVDIEVSMGKANDESATLGFAVRDTGTGIGGDRLDQLLDTQVEKDIIEQAHTGLGLFLVKKIVQQFCGELTAVSELGRGSVFEFDAVFSLPELKPKLVSDIKAREHNSGDKKVVLVVEDNPVNRIVAVKLLEKSGHIACVAVNGEIAVAKWREEQPDLVLMDLNMPNMDGFEATRKIRELEKTINVYTPIVALTASDDKKVFAKCVDAGMDYFLSKPFTPKLLEDVIERCNELKGKATVNLIS